MFDVYILADENDENNVHVESCTFDRIVSFRGRANQYIAEAERLITNSDINHSEYGAVIDSPPLMKLLIAQECIWLIQKF